MQPMAYSTPADNPILTEAQTPTRFLEPIFFRFFCLHNTWQKKKEKISFTCQRAISAEGGFIVPSPFKEFIFFTLIALSN
jgi:hypothetical protein